MFLIFLKRAFFDNIHISYFQWHFITTAVEKLLTKMGHLVYMKRVIFFALSQVFGGTCPLCHPLRSLWLLTATVILECTKREGGGGDKTWKSSNSDLKELSMREEIQIQMFCKSHSFIYTFLEIYYILSFQFSTGQVEHGWLVCQRRKWYINKHDRNPNIIGVYSRYLIK